MLRSYRFGFATNSSSSHSIILHPLMEAKQRYHADTPWSGARNPCRDDDYSLIHAQDRAGYMAHAIMRQWSFEQREPSAHERTRVAAVFQRAGFSMADLLAHTPALEWSIDNSWCPDGIAMDRWLALMLDPMVSMHVRPECADDGDMYEHCIEVGHARVPFTRGVGVRWKQDGDAIVSFDMYNGSKFRWSPNAYEKATTPELVDVKITDWCGFGCSFCYQGSTTQGAHAPLERILAIFDALAALDVFEVALGGGEPLAHPDIAAILEGATERGLCVALTTFDKNLAYRTDLEALFRHKGREGRVSAIGISVHGHKDVARLIATKQAMERQKIYNELVAQTVVGATPLATLERTLDVAIAGNLPLLLLGYKTTGRGAGRERAINTDHLRRILVKAKNARSMPDIIGTDPGFRLGVDTAFLDAHGDLLDSIGVPALLRSSPEGKFSMYVDAVAGTCGPSSYCDEALMEPITDLRDQFARW